MNGWDDPARVRRGLVYGVIVVLAILYFTGSLDTFLYKFHLNYHRCAQNGYGAVFCGKALEEYEGNYDRATDYGNLP